MKCTCQEMEKMDVKELRQKRFELLEEIHKKQQELDQMDYQIYKKKKEMDAGD